MSLNAELTKITDRIVARSAQSREAYLARMQAARRQGPSRSHLSCSGQAHAFAAAGPDQGKLASGQGGNRGLSQPIMTCSPRTSRMRSIPS